MGTSPKIKLDPTDELMIIDVFIGTNPLDQELKPMRWVRRLAGPRIDTGKARSAKIGPAVHPLGLEPRTHWLIDANGVRVPVVMPGRRPLAPVLPFPRRRELQPAAVAA